MNDTIQPRELCWRDRWLAMRAGLLIPVIEIWLRKSSFQRCQLNLQKTARFLSSNKMEMFTIQDVLHIAKLVDLDAPSSLYPADCLTRSLAVHIFLQHVTVLNRNYAWA